MFTLSNSFLTVEILDPVVDVAHMGARYCTGGYIFQVHDHAHYQGHTHEHSSLLSGPTYPGPFQTFHGQGIPDAFNLNPLRAVGAGNEALIIGVGLCELNPDYTKNAVKSFCEWQIESSNNTLTFCTTQRHHDWALNLTRTVSLMGRTVRSHTLLQNIGTAAIPMRWFPHPFYPQTATNELIKLNCDVTFAENAGYEMNANGFIGRKSWPWPRDFIWRSIITHRPIWLFNNAIRRLALSRLPSAMRLISSRSGATKRPSRGSHFLSAWLHLAKAMLGILIMIFRRYPYFLKKR
jgi:hypothetical protein